MRQIYGLAEIWLAEVAVHHPRTLTLKKGTHVSERSMIGCIIKALSVSWGCARMPISKKSTRVTRGTQLVTL